MTNTVTEISKSVENISSFINLANATIGALIIFGGYLIAFTRRIKPYISITEDLTSLKTEVSKISNEFKANGGKSLKDQINSLETSAKTILYRQRWILDNRQEPIFETDEKGDFTWVNDAFVRLTDRPFRDLKNKNWINCLKEETRSEITECWNLAIQNKRNFEHILFVVDSKNRIFSTKCVAVHQEDGNYIGSFMDVEKITEKKS